MRKVLILIFRIFCDWPFKMQVKKMIYTRKDSLKKRGEKPTRTQGEEDTGKSNIYNLF